MISIPLLKKNFKSNILLLIGFMLILSMYFSIIVSMFSPGDLNLSDLMNQMNFPVEFMEAFGFVLTDTSLSGYIASYFYGFLMLVFPMVAYIVIANKLVASLVDKASMSYLLSTNNSRKKIIMTQALFLLLSVVLLVVFITIFGAIFCMVLFPEYFILSEFIMTNLGVLLLHFAISSICFASSCYFNDTKHSLMFGAGIPIAFILIKMINDASDKFGFLEYLTIYSLYDPLLWMKSSDILVSIIGLSSICICFYGFGIYYFTKKDLHI